MVTYQLVARKHSVSCCHHFVCRQWVIAILLHFTQGNLRIGTSVSHPHKDFSNRICHCGLSLTQFSIILLIRTRLRHKNLYRYAITWRNYSVKTCGTLATSCLLPSLVCHICLLNITRTIVLQIMICIEKIA